MTGLLGVYAQLPVTTVFRPAVEAVPTHRPTVTVNHVRVRPQKPNNATLKDVLVRKSTINLTKHVIYILVIAAQHLITHFENEFCVILTCYVICKACVRLTDPKNGRVSCTRDRTSHVCDVICDEGHELPVAPPEGGSRCGPETFYLWSHQGPDNPSAWIPDCTGEMINQHLINLKKNISYVGV